MLVLSESATTAIRELVDRPELPDVAGLRIAPAESGSGLSVSTAGLPEEGDQVVENEGARVYLEPTAAAVLDDKVLDATLGDQGRVEFMLHSQ